jgi:hypothetical protein
MGTNYQAVRLYCQSVVSQAAHFAQVLRPNEDIDISDYVPREPTSPMNFTIDFGIGLVEGAVYFTENHVFAAQIAVKDTESDKTWWFAFDTEENIHPLDKEFHRLTRIN